MMRAALPGILPGDPTVDPAVDVAVEPFAGITRDLAGRGFAVADGFVSADWADELRKEQQLQSRQGAFRLAGIGRDDGYQLAAQTRGDHIHWLEQGSALPAQGRYLALLEELRLAVNRELFLGLYESETHAAIYPPGSSYRRHLDGFRQGNLRTLSIILYLNPDWHEHNGGALRLYLDANADGECVDVLPESGRLVAFLSERFHHEVLTTRRARSSITTWFSRRAL